MNVEKKTILRKVLLTGVATASVAIVLASSAIAADQQPETVIVTGSFHTVGDALARLPGFAPVG